MPVHIFYGDESYLLSQACHALRHELLPPGMESLCHKVLKRPALHEVVETLSAMSLNFGNAELIEILEFNALVKKIDGKADLAQLETLKAILDSLSPNRHVLFYGDKVDRKLKFPKWLTSQSHFTVREFKQFSFWETDKAAQQLVHIAKERQIQIQPQAAKQLVENMGVALQPLINELEKLSLYALNRAITVQDIYTLSDHNENTFQMINDWIKNRPRALLFKTLDELLLRQHVAPLYGLTQTQLHHVFQLKYLRQMGVSEKGIAERLKKHPFKVKKDLEEFQAVPLQRLVHLKEQALQLEWQYKTGQLDSRLSYEMLLGH